jgi:hypothetical protein
MPASPARIVSLCDRPALIPELARWFVAEWTPYYGPGGPGAGAAERDIRNCCNRDVLPMALVALDDGDRLVGTAALKADSLDTHSQLGPWLAALVTSPDVADTVESALVQAIEAEARRLGFDAVYTGMDEGSAVMLRRGWSVIGQSNSLRGPIAVFEKTLA